jgi:hypothetical protein
MCPSSHNYLISKHKVSGGIDIIFKNMDFLTHVLNLLGWVLKFRWCSRAGAFPQKSALGQGNTQIGPHILRMSPNKGIVISQAQGKGLSCETKNICKS